VATFTQKAVHENKFARGKAHGLDLVLWRDAPVVKQRHVGREVRRDPALQSRLRHRPGQGAMKLHGRVEIVDRAQHERPRSAATVAAKTPCAIERNFELRRQNRIPRPPSGIYQRLRQALMIARAMQRNVQPLGRRRFSRQPGIAAKLLAKTENSRSILGLRQQREKQAIIDLRTPASSRKTKLLGQNRTSTWLERKLYGEYDQMRRCDRATASLLPSSAPAGLLHDVDLADEEHNAGQENITHRYHHEDVGETHHHGLAVNDLRQLL
jgi:hypothetical protein